MGPYWVFATVPVTVRVATAAVALTLGVARAVRPPAGLAEPDPVPRAAAGDVPADAGGVLAAGAGAASGCDLYESSAASPAKVPPRVRTARRIKEPPGAERGAGQKSKDSRWMRRRGMPAASSDCIAVWVMPGGPQT